jgi:predicted negative regulator of RcsB-dependent stress response
VKTETRHALKHDKFIDQTQQGIGWVSSNRTKVATAVVIALVVIGLIIGITVWQQHRSEQASNAFGVAMSIYSAPLAQPGAPPLPGSYPSANARATAAHQKFQDVAAQYGSTEIGKTSRYFAGLTSIETGNPGAAESDLKAIADSGNRNLSNLAKIALAGVYQSSKRENQAAELYQQVISKPSTTVPATTAELQLAGLYEQTAPDKAKALYAKVKDEDKTGAAGQQASQKLSGQPQQQ